MGGFAGLGMLLGFGGSVGALFCRMISLSSGVASAGTSSSSSSPLSSTERSSLVVLSGSSWGADSAGALAPEGREEEEEEGEGSEALLALGEGGGGGRASWSRGETSSRSEGDLGVEEVGEGTSMPLLLPPRGEGLERTGRGGLDGEGEETLVLSAAAASSARKLVSSLCFDFRGASTSASTIEDMMLSLSLCPCPCPDCSPMAST